MAPTVQSLILADHVYQDAQTGKKVIAGTFNRIYRAPGVTNYPCNVFAYLALRNCHGKQKLSVKYVDLKDESVLLESSELPIDASDRLQTYEVVMEVPPLPLPHTGQYSFEVFCNGERIGELRLSVVDIPKPGEGHGQP